MNKITAQPILHEYKDKKYYEQVLLRDENNYPIGLCHVDSFWEGRDGANLIYNELMVGHPVELEIRLAKEAK